MLYQWRTNMKYIDAELLVKIKATIEKRIALMKELIEREGTCDFALGSIDALQGLLDTVISPIFDKEVREKVREHIDH